MINEEAHIATPAIYYIDNYVHTCCIASACSTVIKIISQVSVIFKGLIFTIEFLCQLEKKLTEMLLCIRVLNVRNNLLWQITILYTTLTKPCEL